VKLFPDCSAGIPRRAIAPSKFLDPNREITFEAHGLTETSVWSHIDEPLVH
jgi:hypothetical protein